MDQNPYAINEVAASAASADARATFLQRTYSLLLAGVFCFAATLWAAANVPAVNSLAVGLYQGGMILCLVVVIGGGYLVRKVAHRHPINLIAYFAYTFVFGLLLAPIVLFSAQAMPDVLTQASLITVLIFTGLTGYVFVSGKDFSFMGGALAIGMFAMLGVGLAGYLIGFEVGLWYSAAGVVLFSGYILYDTSRVLHHLPTNAHVAAAIELFVSLILLFQHVLHLLMSVNND